MSPSRKSAGIATLFSLAVNALPVDAMAKDSQDEIAASSIVNELSCRREPNGPPAAAYLAKKRYIKLKDNVGADSVSCWKLARPFDLAGLPVEGLCTFSDDALMHVLWPDVFYRGPGTFPGTMLSISTAADEDTVRKWAKARGLESANTGKSDWFEGMTQVECNASSIEHIPEQ